MDIDDQVNYVPDLVYATKRDADGDYPWVFGKKRVSNRKETIEEVDHEQTHNEMQFLRRHANPTEHMAKFVHLRPRKMWKAVVTEVNDDGTVDVDVVGAAGGVMLHLRNVPVDPTGTKPHTVHESLVTA